MAVCSNFHAAFIALVSFLICNASIDSHAAASFAIAPSSHDCNLIGGRHDVFIRYDTGTNYVSGGRASVKYDPNVLELVYARGYSQSPFETTVTVTAGRVDFVFMSPTGRTAIHNQQSLGYMNFKTIKDTTRTLITVDPAMTRYTPELPGMIFYGSTWSVKNIAQRFKLNLRKEGLTGYGMINSYPSPESDDKYSSGTVVSLSGSMGHGWSFQSWGGDVVSSDWSIKVKMDRDKYIVGYFGSLGGSYQFCTFRAAPNTVDGGTVTAIPAPDPFGMYGPNTGVTLVAEPKKGYAFDSWSGSASGKLPVVQFKTTAGFMTITANFVKLRNAVPAARWILYQ